MSLEKTNQFLGKLKQCQILENLTQVELEEISEHLHFEDFAKGENILTEGRQSQGLWLILRGQCSVLKHCGEMQSQLATLEPGSVIGEMSFFEVVPHSATVRANSAVQMVCLPREEFEQLRLSCPAISEKIVINLVKLISDRLRQMDQWTCRLVDSGEHAQKHLEWHEFRARLYSNLFD